MEMMKSWQEMRSCCFTTFDCETTLRVKSVENQFRSVEFWSKVSLQVGCNSLHQRVLLFWWHRMSLIKRCKVSRLLILKSKVVVVKSQREDYLWKSVGKGRRQSIQQMLPLLKMSWWWLGWWLGWWRLECGRQEESLQSLERVSLSSSRSGSSIDSCPQLFSSWILVKEVEKRCTTKRKRLEEGWCGRCSCRFGIEKETDSASLFSSIEFAGKREEQELSYSTTAAFCVFHCEHSESLVLTAPPPKSFVVSSSRSSSVSFDILDSECSAVHEWALEEDPQYIFSLTSSCWLSHEWRRMFRSQTRLGLKPTFPSVFEVLSFPDFMVALLFSVTVLLKRTVKAAARGFMFS